MDAAVDEVMMFCLKVILWSFPVQNEEIQKNPYQVCRHLVNQILNHYRCANLLNEANRKLRWIKVMNIQFGPFWVTYPVHFFYSELLE
jgi:hypothetical protein